MQVLSRRCHPALTPGTQAPGLSGNETHCSPLPDGGTQAPRTQLVPGLAQDEGLTQPPQMAPQSWGL